VTEANKMAVMDLISEPMKAVVAKSAELSADAYDTSGELGPMRIAYGIERRFWNEGGPQMAKTEDATIDTPDGPVAVRFHTPDGATANAPVIVYIHGGGWVLGNLDTHDGIMRRLAQATQAIVVGVDYSLSPEAKFPTALHQCAAVARHLVTEGAAHGVDGARQAFAGDSGGASLSLATYLYLRDTGDASFVKALLLYYGLYGLRDSVSRRLLGGPWDGLTADDLAYYMDCYLASPADAASPYVDCLAADLSDLPPAFVAAAEFDPLRDDSAALAQMLDRHERCCRQVVYPGVLHAFLHNSRLLPDAINAINDGAAFFTSVINNPDR